MFRVLVAWYKYSMEAPLTASEIHFASVFHWRGGRGEDWMSGVFQSNNYVKLVMRVLIQNYDTNVNIDLSVIRSNISRYLCWCPNSTSIRNGRDLWHQPIKWYNNHWYKSDLVMNLFYPELVPVSNGNIQSADSTHCLNIGAFQEVCSALRKPITLNVT